MAQVGYFGVCRVQGFRVLGLGFWVLVFGFWVEGFGLRVQVRLSGSGLSSSSSSSLEGARYSGIRNPKPFHAIRNMFEFLRFSPWSFYQSAPTTMRIPKPP